jgi:DNA gyrase/topoisomerase IV subunit B
MNKKVGLTVTTALSDYFSISSYRDMKVKTIEFVDGTLREIPVKKLKKEERGTIVKFIPSEKYLGPVDMTTDIIENYLRCLSYILRPDLKINFYGKKKGLDTLITRKYKHEGLSNNVKFISSSLEFEPVSITFSNDNFDLDLSFSYDRTLDETIINSYCNYVITSEGGNHEIASQRAICEFLSREGRKLDPNNKYEITFDDCKKGLIICVNGKHVNPVFEGQHKSKVSNRDFLSDGKKGISEELTKYFNTNNGLLRKIIGYLRQISKIRLEANKIKGVSIKKISTFLDDAEIKGFNNISDRSYTGYKELIITEGDLTTSLVS